MKKLIIIAICLWSVAKAQVPGYTTTLTRMNYSNGIATGGLIIPAGATATKPSGSWVRSGFIFYDTTGVDTGLYVSHGTYWVKVGVGSFNTSLGSGYKIAVNGTNDVKSLTATNGLTADSATAGQVGIKLGGTLTANTRISGANFYYVMDSLGHGSLFRQRSRAIVSNTMAFSNKDATDSAYLFLSGANAGSKIAQIGVSNSSVATPTNLGSYLRFTSGGATGSTLFADIYTAIDAGDVGEFYSSPTETLIKSYLLGSNRWSQISMMHDSSTWWQGLHRTAVINMKDGAQDQFARDSVTWRLTNNDALLTLNSTGWHAWQKDGEYYFYNVERETDTTGFDILAWDRAASEMKRIPSNLIGGGGGGSQTPWTGNINADGFTLFGNDGSGETMTISSTSHATKGNIDFTTAKIDQANNWIIANAANTNKLYLGEASGYPLMGFGSSAPGISTYAFLGDVAGGGTLLNGQTYLTLKNNNNDIAKVTATGMGIFTTPSVPFHVLGTTEQMRLAYDGSNYLSATISSDGTSTFGVTGSVQRVIFNDHVFVNGPATFNDNGGAFVFRVESDNNADMLHVDGVNDRVGIGTAPAVQFHTTGAVRLANFGAGTATFDASGNISSVSDGRLKNIVGNYKAGLKEIMQLNPIVYKWKKGSGMETTHKYAGLDAREVYKVFGDLGSGENGEGYRTVQDRALIAALINSVKELQARIEHLEKQIR